MQMYDVIIVGGGPTGIALGIELGLNKINALILEKYDKPLLSPRAISQCKINGIFYAVGHC